MMDNPPVAGRGINNSAAACSNSHMAAYHNNIACLNVGKIINSGIPPYIAPAGRGDITLPYTYLI